MGFLWNCWRPSAQFRTGTAGLRICRRHHGRHYHQRIAPCRLYRVPSVRGRIWCQAEPFQIQGDVVGRMETSLRLPGWFGLGTTPTHAWRRPQCIGLHQTRRGSPLSKRLKRGWRPGVDEASHIRGEHLSSMLLPCRRLGICVPFSQCQAGLPP